MRKVMALALVLAVLTFGSMAWAAEQIVLNCLDMPYCCQISCVEIDLECCGCGCVAGSGPFNVEFLNMKGEVLGTAVFGGDWCCGESIARLDKPVNANDVCSVRLVKPDGSVAVVWASLRVFCGDECCGKWRKIFKGDLWCWQPVPAPKPAPVVEQTPPPAEPEAPAAVEPEPETKPDFSEFPEPEPEPEPEVIIVPGKG